MKVTLCSEIWVAMKRAEIYAGQSAALIDVIF
jgi:hypothetical protein